MSGLALWQRPVLRRDEDEDRERKATWLELFYDLVFVVIIAQLSHGLARDVSWHRVAAFALPFVLGITAVGAAVLGVVEYADHGVEAPVRWLLCGAVATVFVCLALLTMVVKRAAPQHSRKVPVTGLPVGAVVALAIASVDAIHGPIVLVGVLLVIVVALVAVDVWLRRVPA